MHADLVQVHVFAGVRIGAQALEDLNGNRINRAAKLLGNGLMEFRSRGRVFQYGEVLGCNVAGIARRTLTEHVGLT
ncbi:hypothetical protein, partial [Klebsiella pneumoniae]|uniref:hypothetical protein n=1 Tax=Klebsiella pneumoniae TaxID=573 RepID=UPI002157F3B4